jgi:hypothetical protein
VRWFPSPFPLYVIVKQIDGDLRLGDSRAHIRRVCGDALVEKCKPIFGLDSEGEIQGALRDIGVRGLWYIMGMCDFNIADVCGP